MKVKAFLFSDTIDDAYYQKLKTWNFRGEELNNLIHVEYHTSTPKTIDAISSNYKFIGIGSAFDEVNNKEYGMIALTSNIEDIAKYTSANAAKQIVLAGVLPLITKKEQILLKAKYMSTISIRELATMSLNNINYHIAWKGFNQSRVVLWLSPTLLDEVGKYRLLDILDIIFTKMGDRLIGVMMPTFNDYLFKVSLGLFKEQKGV